MLALHSIHQKAVDDSYCQYSLLCAQSSMLMWMTFYIPVCTFEELSLIACLPHNAMCGIWIPCKNVVYDHNGSLPGNKI